MKIAVDAMGGDHAPSEIVDGAVQAAREFGVEILLTGHEDSIQRELQKHSTVGLSIKTVQADDVIEMHEHPAQALRQKKHSSMGIAVELVQSGEVGGAVSAGNSGAMMAASLFTLKRLPGIERPALGQLFPTETGRCMVIDIGANTDCKPTYLEQFALMGSEYMKLICGIQKPKIGLLSNGEEEGKGDRLVQEAFELLTRASESGALFFAGNIEGKDITSGNVDVIVCDGFVGNVVLKNSEGIAGFITRKLKDELTSSLYNKILAALLKPAFKKAFKQLDYEEYGGAPLLGVNGVAVISHGRSRAKAIKNAIRVAFEAAENNLPAKITAGLATLPSFEEMSETKQKSGRE